jgi:hypothetical protein
VDLAMTNPDLTATDAIVLTREGRTKYGYYVNVEQSAHKVHGGPLQLRRSPPRRDSRSVPIEERLHVLRRDQTHRVAERYKLAANVMGA